MASRLQIRRANTAVAAAFTGAPGELFLDNDTWSLKIHDGTTVGGRAVGGGGGGTEFGLYNLAIGQDAAKGMLNDFGYAFACYNLAIGPQAMQNSFNVDYSPTSGNIAVGFAAMKNVARYTDWGYTKGTTSVGFKSMAGRLDYGPGPAFQYSLANSTYNTSIGAYALQFGISTSYNVAVGSNAMWQAQYVCNNVVVGASAAPEFGRPGSYKQPCNNVVIGAHAVRNATFTKNSVLIGGYVGKYMYDIGCATVIGYKAGYGEAGIVPGSICITAGVNVNGYFPMSSLAVRPGTDAQLYVNGSGWYQYTPSDARDKTNVQPLTVGLEFLRQTKPVQWTWDKRTPNPNKDGTQEIGFLAQDLQQLTLDASLQDLVKLVVDNNPERLQVKMDTLIPIIVNSIKELATRVEALENK